MLELKEIKDIISGSIVPVLKEHSPFYWNNKKDKIPGYYPGYSLAVKYARRCKIHGEVGDFEAAKEIFEANAPNETDKEIAYVKANYKQTTLPVFLDFHSTMMRMFADNDWYMEYTEDQEKFKDQTMQQYIETGIRVFGSLENYFKSLLVHCRELDANGLLAIKPHRLVKTIEDGSEVAISELELYEPQPYYYRADQVVAKSYDEYYLVLLDEKSIIKIGDRKEKKGFIFELYDDQNIYRITQTGKAEDFRFEYGIYFNHGEGVIPCMELGGEPQLVNGYVVWQPKFLYACDLLDIALVINQYLRATHANVCFPYRVMLGNRCNASYTDANGTISPCVKGYVYDSELGRDIHCPTCKGFGLVDRVSRQGQMLIDPNNDFGLQKGDSPQMVANAMYYVSPETSSLQFTSDLEDKTIDQARSLLHLKTTSTKAQPNADGSTAIGDTLDSKAMTAFIRPESFQVFTLFEFATDRIGWQRYEKDYKPVYFKYPNNFDTTTDSDYLRRISEMQVANVPTALIEAEIDKYIQSLYYNEKDNQDKYKLIAKTDRLFFLSQEDINTKLSRGTADKWESVLHDSSGQIVDMLIEEHVAAKGTAEKNTCIYPYVCTPELGFYSYEFKDQQQYLIDKAKEIAAAITGAAQQTGDLIEEIAGGASAVADNLGKLPLGIQQLTLSSTRAREGSNEKLASAIDKKAMELVKNIDPTP